jgi:hypothetical protein
LKTLFFSNEETAIFFNKLILDLNLKSIFSSVGSYTDLIKIFHNLKIIFNFHLKQIAPPLNEVQIRENYYLI